MTARRLDGDDTRKASDTHMYERYSDKLIEEMRQHQPEELEINGVRLLTKSGVIQKLDCRQWERENAERKIKRFAAIWSVLNSAAIIVLAIALLSKR